MAQLINAIPNDAEINAMTQPKNPQAAEELQHRKCVKKRLDEYLEAQQLKRAMGDDDFWA
ncbi:PA3496 family putative envelope integrity protein [Shewanella intestini]|uniref:Uncharacterized protein n=1 Tax=Shewanella intestini TaxID=2017544 RepID=A0ABS5I3E3_9GAMM|nr:MULTISPECIES: hypothetical protein [Shewanella]MBR9728548.1 hypothetical protein [Shewanella intestini]MRG36367.1 hypothetical protein [Shewanella sp. XMDDZSB0408]